MRVRPLFWIVFATVCLGVLVLASLVQPHAPASMQVHLGQQPPQAHALTTVLVHITDLQGVPIEQAHVLSRANMTNMDMQVVPSRVSEVAPGDYLTQLHLYTAGPWAITISVQAEGFAPLEQVVLVQVV
ncbi:MAG: FixH family protein [Ktedonobacteraceae bacterium]|nr:FixH family protein [Ktedonobacteraceae bacterium]